MCVRYCKILSNPAENLEHQQHSPSAMVGMFDAKRQGSKVLP